MNSSTNDQTVRTSLIERSSPSGQSFFLYAETYLPDEKAQTETLAALQLCADGTGRETPGVATYVFRPSKLAGVTGEMRHPGSFALESTELYLTHQSFRDHLTTAEFRTGLRTMYKGTKRLGARLFWIGARPASDMLHNIFRSDPEARPIATISEKLFDEAVHRRTRNEDVAIVSVLCPLVKGSGAVAIDAVEAVAGTLDSISLVAFFHPLASEILRMFLVIPISNEQSTAKVAEVLKPLTVIVDPTRRMLVNCQTHRSREDLAAELRTSLAGSDVDFEVTCGAYSGYVSHPLASSLPVQRLTAELAILTSAG